MHTNILWAIAFVILTICIYVALTSYSPAHAEYLAELWKGYTITPDQKDAIRKARIPGKTECCGTADGVPTDWDIKNGHYWANWDGAWRQIPDEDVLKEMDKPVPFAIIWLTNGNKYIQDPESGDQIDQGYRDVRCFWPGAGG